MSTQVQRRKGTTAQHASFTGASAELTVDTTKNTVVVHDGATAGGIPLAKETGSALSATSLSLPNSTTNGVAFVNSSKVVVAGSTFTFDGDSLSVNGITVGKGGGAQATNTSVGALALGINVDGQQNTVVGYNAMKGLTSANRNTAVGAVALWTDSNGWDNTALGWGALFASTGTGNTAVGMNAGGSMSSGSKNTIIGSFSGNGGGLDIRTASNYIVLSDGDANPRAWWNGANPTFPGVLTLSDGTANGVPYLNGSKQVTTGSALTFDGTNFAVTGASTTSTLSLFQISASAKSGLWVDGSDFNFGTFYNNALIFKQSNTEAMRLTSTGLGIGTSSPAVRLHVKAATDAANVLQIQDASQAQTLNLGVNNVNGGPYIFVGTNHALRFGTNDTERMRIDSSGNLTLGNATAGANRFLYINGVVNKAGAIGFQESGVNKWLVGNGAASENGNFEIYNANGNNTVITPAGNLGLGVTPNTGWASGYKVVQNLGTSWFGTTSRDANFGTNVYVAAGGYKYIDASAASLYTQFLGAHSWYSSTSAQVAGTDPVFSQAMTLDASGALLVGVTTTGLANANYFYFDPAAGYGGNALIGHISGIASGVPYLAFAYNGTSIGSITQAGTTGVLYNVTSDYRLKDIDGPVTTSGAFIDSLKPVQGSWKADGSRFIGFLAHELQEASETVVGTGVKDGEEMQSIDYSNAELIANLVAEIQDLRKRLAAAGIA